MIVRVRIELFPERDSRHRTEQLTAFFLTIHSNPRQSTPGIISLLLHPSQKKVLTRNRISENLRVREHSLEENGTVTESMIYVPTIDGLEMSDRYNFFFFFVAKNLKNRFGFPNHCIKKRIKSSKNLPFILLSIHLFRHTKRLGLFIPHLLFIIILFDRSQFLLTKGRRHCKLWCYML